jgi:protein involved in polysaccharide export with SLBB domain
MKKLLPSRIIAFMMMFAMMGMESSWVFAQNLPNLTPAAPSAAAGRAAAPAAPTPGAPSGTITLPPGVSLPPGIQVPKGVNVRQSDIQGQGQGQGQTQAQNAESSQGSSKQSDGKGDLSSKKSGSIDVTNDPAIPNAFQTFLLQITGKAVPIYGEELFNRANPFAALESVPVPANYILGPGDEITVKIYSPAIDIDQRFIINKDGTISLPKIGPVPIAGTQVSEVEAKLKSYLGRMISDFNVYVTVGQLKGIEVYVVGETRRPGKYVVSSVSTLINALFATGGPSSNGSMRNIQLVRQGQVIGSVDLYQFLRGGDSSKDMNLMTGDVIKIPPVGPQIAMLGQIPNPAIYELAPGQSANSLQSMILYAGNLSIFTSPLQASIERIDPTREKPLSALSISLDKAGLATNLKGGDIITFMPIKPAFENAISLRLLGLPSVRIPIKPGATLRDVIPNKEALLTNLYFLRRFTPPSSGDGNADDQTRIRASARLDQINWDHALLERINPSDLSPEIISFNLGEAISASDPKYRIPLKSGDIITIFSQKDIQVPVSKQTRIVRVQGEVRNPGIYQIRAGDTLPMVIDRAGGLTNDAYVYGTEFSRESVRNGQRKNIASVIRNLENQLAFEAKNLPYDSGNAADLQRQQAMQALNRANLQTKIEQLKTSNPNGRLSLELNPNDAEYPELLMEDGDLVSVPEIPSSVAVIGAVYNESGLLYKEGKTANDYLANAGVSVTAERDWTFLVRADGSIKAPDTSGWSTSGKVFDIVLMPGDVVVVPEKIQRETGYTTFMRGLKDWTQVLFQLGLAAAAVQVLK